MFGWKLFDIEMGPLLYCLDGCADFVITGSTGRATECADVGGHVVHHSL